MPNINNIDGFILSGFYPKATTTAQLDASRDFKELINTDGSAKTFAIGTTSSATTAKIIKFDFKDGDKYIDPVFASLGNNDGQLQDTDNEGTGIAGRTPDNNAAGDRIVINGTEHIVVNLGRLMVRMNTDHGSIDGIGGGFRVYQLDNGDVVLRPLDTQVTAWNNAGTNVSQWKSLSVTNVPSNTGANNTTYTTMASQDADFPTCFARGTMIQTLGGAAVPIETLSAGDMVLTRDNGPQPVRWIGSRKLSAAELTARPELGPMRITAGALGRNRPGSDLMVSPQHRILIRSKIAQRMFSADEVLVAAKHLLELDGIEVVRDVTEIEYFHILFDQHEIVFSNGAETESFYTGPQALKSLWPAARTEIFTLFPELRDQNQTAIYPPARPLVSGRRSKQFIVRHNKNNHYLTLQG